MGTGDIYYDTSSWDGHGHLRYRTSYGDYIIPASTISEYTRYLGDSDYNDFLTEWNEDRIQYEDRTKKFNEILYDVLLDFAGSGIKLIHPDSPHIFVGCSKLVIENIIIEGSNKKTTLTYDPETHEISGFVWMSLGDRDLTEATEEEVGIIRRALLIWIYENI
jgi:hypothetical protein